MRHFMIFVFTGFLGLSVLTSPCRAVEPPQENFPELDQAKRTGWQITIQIVNRLEADNQDDFPGIQAWLKNFRKATKGINLQTAPNRWPVKIDADALMTRNPNFWRAYYEIAPADPGMMLLQAGLLLAAGEVSRASHVALIAGQVPGVPQYFRRAFDIILALCGKVHQKAATLVNAGTKLHDKREYAAALQKYQEALALWPQDAYAHYEKGLSLMIKEIVAKGQKPPPPGTILINGKNQKKLSPKVEAAFAKSRRHDPFRFRAYQGTDKNVIRGMMSLLKKGFPVWKKLLKDRKQQLDDDALIQLASACQDAGNHELALSIRQIIVARRKGFAPEDHPFISKSLRELVPGKKTEKVLARLAGDGKLRFRQLIIPENNAP